MKRMTWRRCGRSVRLSARVSDRVIGQLSNRVIGGQVIRSGYQPCYLTRLLVAGLSDRVIGRLSDQGIKQIGGLGRSGSKNQSE
jgi:hypothetical protein